MLLLKSSLPIVSNAATTDLLFVIIASTVDLDPENDPSAIVSSGTEPKRLLCVEA